MKKTLTLSIAFVGFFIFTGCGNGSQKTVKKEEKVQNYTIDYALAHYKNFGDFLKDLTMSDYSSFEAIAKSDNKFIRAGFTKDTYVLKGDGSNKHAGGWWIKQGKGNMIESGHEKGKVDYIVTTDNRDVTTLGTINKAFNQK